MKALTTVSLRGNQEPSAQVNLVPETDDELEMLKLMFSMKSLGISFTSEVWAQQAVKGDVVGTDL